MISDDELVAAWLARYPRNTARAYKRDIELLKPWLYGKGLRELNDDEVTAYGGILANLGVGAATARRRVMSFKSLLRFGREVGYIDPRPPPHSHRAPSY